MNKDERVAYKEGYLNGILKGKRDTERMKMNADGCEGCAFQDVEPWQMPCDRCSRNSKDYWRAKKVE